MTPHQPDTSRLLGFSKAHAGTPWATAAALMGVLRAEGFSDPVNENSHGHAAGPLQLTQTLGDEGDPSAIAYFSSPDSKTTSTASLSWLAVSGPDHGPVVQAVDVWMERMREVFGEPFAQVNQSALFRPDGAIDGVDCIASMTWPPSEWPVSPASQASAVVQGEQGEQNEKDDATQEGTSALRDYERKKATIEHPLTVEFIVEQGPQSDWRLYLLLSC